MTDSKETQQWAHQIIHELVSRLDDGRLAQQIDAPIDRATAEYECPPETTYSADEFHNRVADFVRYLYRRALPAGRRLSDGQAHDEAIALLQQCYEGVRDNGYDAAAMDAADPSLPGLPAVLIRLAESVKARQREMAARCIVTRVLGAAGWQTRCAVAAILIDRVFKGVPSPPVRPLPAQMATAEGVLDLLRLDQETSGQLAGTLPT